MIIEITERTEARKTINVEIPEYQEDTLMMELENPYISTIEDIESILEKKGISYSAPVLVYETKLVEVV